MNVDVTVRGAVPDSVVQRVETEIGALEGIVKGPLTGARVLLAQDEAGHVSQPARAEGEVLLAGRPVRARVAAPDLNAAADALAERMAQQLRRHVDRIITRQRRPAATEPGQWRHGGWTPARPPRSWRAPGERELVRRKTFALEPMDALEAAADLEALDHDFYLYRDADTGADSVVYRDDEGRLEILQPQGLPEDPPRRASRYADPLELATVLAEMDELNHRFLYFTDARTGRGCVVYLRADGHYGLIEPADAA